MGFCVMLLHNIDLFRGQVNGSYYNVEAVHFKTFLPNSLNVENVVHSLALPLMPSGSGDSNLPSQRFMSAQSHVRACFAITVNKSTESVI